MKKTTLNKLSKTDLVLSGGGSKGIFQAGVLYELQANDIKFNRIFGNSVGTLNGVGYATGKFPELYQMWMAIEEGRLNFFTKGFLGMGWLARGIFGGDGIYSNKPLYKLIQQYFKLYDKESLGVIFFDVVDLLSGELFHVRKDENGTIYLHTDTHSVEKNDSKTIVVDSTDDESQEEIWHKLILASTSIPVAFPPVKLTLNGQEYQFVDGGVRNICPANYPIRIGCKRMLVVLTSPREVKPDVIETNVLGIGSRSMELVLNEIYRRDIEQMEFTNNHITQAEKRKGYKHIEYDVIEPDFTLESSLTTDPVAMHNLFLHGCEKAKSYLNKLEGKE